MKRDVQEPIQTLPDSFVTLLVGLSETESPLLPNAESMVLEFPEAYPECWNNGDSRTRWAYNLHPGKRAPGRVRLRAAISGSPCILR